MTDDDSNRLRIAGQSTIKRHFADKNVGLIRLVSELYIVGYIISGIKEIYVGEKVVRYKSGETYFLSVGRHYVKDKVPVNGRFEEILLCLNDNDISIATNDLQRTVSFDPKSPCLNCGECTKKRFFPTEQNESLAAYFNFLDKIMDDCAEIKNRMALQLHFAALTYVLFTRMDKCVRGKMLGGNECDDTSFKRGVYENIFKPLTLVALASALGYSLTAFKSKFKILFGMAPHEWILKERLKHSKFLLGTTAKSISAIGKLCCFSNPGQFTRNFKKMYGMTPKKYRKRKTRELCS